MEVWFFPSLCFPLWKYRIERKLFCVFPKYCITEISAKYYHKRVKYFNHIRITEAYQIEVIKLKFLNFYDYYIKKTTPTKNHYNLYFSEKLSQCFSTFHFTRHMKIEKKVFFLFREKSLVFMA